MRRRDVLRWLSGAAGVSAAGCLGSLPGAAGEPATDPSPTPAASNCAGAVHRSPTPTESAPLPWDLEINQIGLAVFPVTVEVTDRSADPPATVTACTARSASQERLSFDIEPDREYRFRAVLHRPEDPAEASMTLFGRRLAPNSMLEVTMADDGFVMRHVHYDLPETASG